MRRQILKVVVGRPARRPAVAADDDPMDLGPERRPRLDVAPVGLAPQPEPVRHVRIAGLGDAGVVGVLAVAAPLLAMLNVHGRDTGVLGRRRQTHRRVIVVAGMKDGARAERGQHGGESVAMGLDQPHLLGIVGGGEIEARLELGDDVAELGETGNRRLLIEPAGRGAGEHALGEPPPHEGPEVER